MSTMKVGLSVAHEVSHLAAIRIGISGKRPAQSSTPHLLSHCRRRINTDDLHGTSESVFNQWEYHFPVCQQTVFVFRFDKKRIHQSISLQTNKSGSSGEHHLEIFTRLCKTVGTKGNSVSEAFCAALAMELGTEWITADRDYARFPGLRWRHPPARSLGGLTSTRHLCV